MSKSNKAMSSRFKRLWITAYFLPLSVAFAQVAPGRLDMDLELKYRKGKVSKEEKYYKNGKLDSVYRQWNHQGQKLTDGYYLNGKKHGDWYEWLSNHHRHDYLLYTYNQGILKKLYEYAGWREKQDSVKSEEYFHVFEPDTLNYSSRVILWDWNLRGGIKRGQEFLIVRNGAMFHWGNKIWENGIPWKQEEEKVLFDKNGKNLGSRKHGRWRIWHKDGTLQWETWYDMGKKLREKRYDHGKLISDTKY